MAKYYGVAQGRVPGVYMDWGDCQAQIKNVSNAKFKKFATAQEAAEFVNKYKNVASKKLSTQIRPSPLPVSSTIRNSTVNSQFAHLSQERPHSSFARNLPLPLSPTKNDSNSKLQASQLSQNVPVSSLTQNLPSPLSQFESGWSMRRPDFQVPQNHQTVEQARDVMLPCALPTPTLNMIQCVSNIPLNDDSWPSVVSATDIPNATAPAQPSGSVIDPVPSSEGADNLEDMLETFEKIYLEFHKQMTLEIRCTKKMLRGFKKSPLALKNASTRMGLQASFGNSLSSFATRCKSIMLDFSSELSSMQKQMAEDKSTARSLLLAGDSPERSASKEKATRAANCRTTAGKMSRRKLSPMMQPMTPTQVQLANKRSYSTDVKTENEPPQKVVKTEVSLELVPTVKVEPPDEVDYGGSHEYNMDADGYVHVFTDGACEKNGYSRAKAGIGVWFGHNHPLNSSEPVRGKPTNNTAEIEAAQYAVELARKAGVRKLCINTDSEFLINCITKWIFKWRRNNWQLSTGTSVKNRDSLQALDEAMKGMKVKWNHVRGHHGILGNEMADSLARAGAARYKCQ